MSKLKIVGSALMAPERDRDFRAAAEDLSAARDLCQKGLSQQRFAPYAEIYDGLLPALRQLVAGELAAAEILPLCRELLHHLSVLTSAEDHFKKEFVFLPYKVSM
ncbi:MAG: hypothetical protein IJS96_04625 [Schwartzia sp.]|nr:hypothetical protein [Schwartzia sp. (in: firmicutes)]